MYLTTLLLSLALWLSSLGLAIFVARRRSALTPTHTLLAGTFAGLTAMGFPIFAQQHPWYLALLRAAHNSLQCFSLNGGFEVMADGARALAPALRGVFLLWAILLYLLAPVLTFSFVLSFFKNISAHRRFLLGFRREAFVFSDLNAKSLALAKSLRAENPKRLLVFTDVYHKRKEATEDLLTEAERLGAVCFKRDILGVDFNRHSKKAGLTFFVMSGDEAENLRHSTGLVERYRNRRNTKLCAFSEHPENELLLHAAQRENDKLQVFRVNEIQSLVYQTLYEHTMFGSKKINAVVLGLGRYGGEMLKALCWCGQMNGYELTIHGFDISPDAQTRLAAACPELLQNYDITIHDGVDWESAAFNETLANIGGVSFVFVALGSDNKSLQAALRLRSFCERQGACPNILAVVYGAPQMEHSLVNSSGQNYGITIVGDLNSQFACKTLIGSELERRALQKHLAWGDEASFYRSEYNYRSSMATAIHEKWRLACGIALEDAPELEHRRWMAYMRGLGYVYGPQRSDRAKTHPDLVPFEQLSRDEQEKDIRITGEAAE